MGIGAGSVGGPSSSSPAATACDLGVATGVDSGPLGSSSTRGTTTDASATAGGMPNGVGVGCTGTPTGAVVGTGDSGTATPAATVWTPDEEGPLP